MSDNLKVGKVRWLVKRLSVLTLAEVIFRILGLVRSLRMRIEYRLGIRKKFKATDYEFIYSSEQKLPMLHFREIPPVEISSILEGGIYLFSSNDAYFAKDDADRWHAGPDTGSLWPRRFFADIPFREGNKTGDIRCVWEGSRLQHCTALAVFAQRTSDSQQQLKAIQRISSDIICWVKQNPLYSGPHYVSSMECALRIISVVLTYDFIRPHINCISRLERTALETAVASLVLEHAEFILKRLSLHSSAGNHVIAEATGLFLAAKYFPEHPMADTWETVSWHHLEHEFARQIDLTGFGEEGATWYLRQVLDYGALINEICSHLHLDRSAHIEDAVVRGTKTLSDSQALVSHFPVVGDSDSAYAISRYFGGEIEPLMPPEQFTYHRNSRMLVAGGGGPYSIIVNYGPLGMGPTYGHGHAHALSLELFKNGEALLFDPGTYSYTGDPSARAFFRSTLSHNTVAIDQQDQAKQELLFLWSEPYKCDLLDVVETEGGLLIVGDHDGYRHLGVRHIRSILFSPDAGLLVKDCLVGGRGRTASIGWNTRCSEMTSLQDLTISLFDMGSWESRTPNVQMMPMSASYGEKEYFSRRVWNEQLESDQEEFLTVVSFSGDNDWLELGKRILGSNGPIKHAGPNAAD